MITTDSLVAPEGPRPEHPTCDIAAPRAERRPTIERADIVAKKARARRPKRACGLFNQHREAAAVLLLLLALVLGAPVARAQSPTPTATPMPPPAGTPCTRVESLRGPVWYGAPVSLAGSTAVQTVIAAPASGNRLYPEKVDIASSGATRVSILADYTEIAAVEFGGRDTKAITDLCLPADARLQVTQTGSGTLTIVPRWTEGR
ncbi:MAG: hypothetical protein ACHQ9S_13740 [Candidatus Binatia bacterium]